MVQDKLPILVQLQQVILKRLQIKLGTVQQYLQLIYRVKVGQIQVIMQLIVNILVFQIKLILFQRQVVGHLLGMFP